MKKFLVIFISLCLLGIPAMQARASEIDLLLEKLVEKNVLTPLEAQIVKDETKQEVAKQMAAGKMDTMPSWIQTIKMKGDLRLRYQTQDKDSYSSWRNRGRYRIRFGAYAHPHPDLEVGFRLASGGDNDSRSTNETFGDGFSKDDVWFDLAYLEYQPRQDFSIIGGKFKRKAYLWNPTDLLWDGDINPEGASLHYTPPSLGSADFFVNAGSWILDDINSHSSNNNGNHTDPFLHYVQAGVGTKGETLDSKLAATYYGFNGIQGIALDNNAGTNTASSGNLVYDYDAVAISAELGAKEILGGLPWGIDKRIAVFGDYVKNISTDVDKDTGWALGAKFGHKKVKKPGTWQMKYIYGELEKDAWPDAFPDSDRYDGKTNMDGHEVAWSYAWKKNVIFGLDYYNTNVKDGASDRQQIIQVDVLVKF